VRKASECRDGDGLDLSSVKMASVMSTSRNVEFVL
jgi:hypothetical protein